MLAIAGYAQIASAETLKGSSGVAAAAAEKLRLPAAAREVEGARGVTTKRFRLGGTSRFAEVATGRVLHHRDAEGILRDNRASLGRDGVDRLADELPVTVRTIAGGVAIASRAAAGRMVFATTERPAATGKRISMRVAGHDVGWFWEVAETELKLVSAPITSPRGVRRYSFPIRYEGGFALLAAARDGSLASAGMTFGAPCCSAPTASRTTAARGGRARRPRP